MKLSLELLRNNVDEHLFNKTLEAFEQYPVMCQGGPLMAYLLFDKILTTTESAIEVLTKKIKTLKIRDQTGEDVDAVVSLIRSTVDVLHSASDDARCYVPDDFPKLVLQVFQTSSNTEFNETFAEEQRTVQRAADRTGKQPQWPTIDGTLLQAERVYLRLIAESKWCVPASKKRHALNAANSSSGRDLSKRTCWNCEKKGCSVEVCKEPVNQSKIDANRAKYRNKRKSSRTRKSGSSNRSGGASPPRDDKGRPLKPNKNGVWIVDQKVYRAEQAKGDDAKPASAPAPAPAPTSDDDTAKTSNTSGSDSAMNAQIKRVQFQVDKLYSAEG